VGRAVVDPRAVVHPGASLGEDVFVGPFCVVGPDVTLGDRTRLESHVVVDGHLSMGPDNVVGPFSSVVIGAANRFCEYVTVSRGTVGGGGVTRIGDKNLFMAYAHIAHDDHVGSRIVFANAATLAGHVEVGDDATVGAFSGVHQFCRIAQHAFIGGYTVVTQDALPWVRTVGNRAVSHGVNIVGLKRKGYAPETVDAIKRCYQTLFRSKLLLKDALEQVEGESGSIPEIRYFLEFVRTSKRGVVR
jgi:UDP-N-acetylglucosamine acyltransferase